MADGSEGVRRGSPTSFWDGTTNGASISAGGVSTAIQTGRGTNMFTVFLSCSGTATFQVQSIHVGAMTNQGIFPTQGATDNPPATPWHDLWYLGTSGLGNSTPITIAGTGAFNIASIIPDFEVDWVRLLCTVGSAVTVTAGFESWGD